MSSSLPPVSENDAQAWKMYQEAQFMRMNYQDSRLDISARQSNLIKRIVGGAAIALLSVSAYVGIRVYRMYSLMEGMVRAIDNAHVTDVSGLSVVLALQNPFLRWWFGPCANINFAEAVWFMFYTQSMRQAIMDRYGGDVYDHSGEPSESEFQPAWTEALWKCRGAAILSPSASAIQLACTSVSSTSNDPETASLCFRPCSFPHEPGGDNVAMGAAEGGLSMAGSLGGLGMMAGGPAGLGLAAVGLIVGGIMGGIEADKKHKQYLAMCNNEKNSGTCYWPKTFPTCT